MLILRRRIERSLTLTDRDVDEISQRFVEIDGRAEVWEYAVLVASLSCDAIAQLYCGDADCELRRIGELDRQFCRAPAQKRESNQRRLIANRL
jgi:hypothetical protein